MRILIVSIKFIVNIKRFLNITKPEKPGKSPNGQIVVVQRQETSDSARSTYSQDDIVT